jgi:type IV pilus assembly protein PilC
MPKFAYAATDPLGRAVHGVARGRSQDVVELRLHDRDLSGIRVRPKKGFLRAELTAPRVKREQVMHLSRQLGAFVAAGLPLIDAVHALRDDAGNSSVRRMLTDVEDGLRGGDTLSDCLDRHPKIFPEYYRGIVASAELSGELDIVLGQLATYLERDLDARRRIRSASIYPGIILLMSLGTVVVLAAFVMPRFEAFFASLHAKLPLPTRMLLAVTGFFEQWWWAILAGLGGVVVLFFLITRTPPGRYARDRIFLSLPVVGSTIRFTLVERFCRLLSSMVGAGVALPEALTVATGSLRNLVFRRNLGRVQEAMLEGEGFAQPLSAARVFPNTAVQMLRVGEETGTLDTQLGITARYYETELDHKIKKLIALFEPMVIIVMGGVVGFVAVALVSAMYGIFSEGSLG